MQALLTPERGRNGKLSNYVWQFVNRVATELAADPNYANKTIACFAYASYRFPPVGFDLADNVELMLAMPTRRLLSDAARDNVATLRQLWTDTVGGRRIHGWNYYNDSMVKRETFGVPMIHPRTIAADIREMAASYDTEFAEGLRYTPVAGEATYDESSLLHPGLNHLNFWVTARAYWNPELDIDAELDLYLTRFFGPAAGSMRLFHDAVESGPWQSWSPTLIQSMLQHLSNAEQEALGAGGGELFRQRVAMIRAESEVRLRQLLDVAKAGYVRTILLESAEDPATFGAPLEGSFRNGFAQYFLADSLAGDERDPLFTTRFGVARSDSYLYLWSQSDEPTAVAAHPAALGDDDLAILRGRLGSVRIRNHHRHALPARSESGRTPDRRHLVGRGGPPDGMELRSRGGSRCTSPNTCRATSPSGSPCRVSTQRRQVGAPPGRSTSGATCRRPRGLPHSAPLSRPGTRRS